MNGSPTNWIDFLVSLSPVMQTGIWASAAVFVATRFKGEIIGIFGSIANRVRQGDDITTPFFSMRQVVQLEAAAQRVEETVREVLNSDAALDKATTNEAKEIIVDSIVSGIKKSNFITINTDRLHQRFRREWMIPHVDFPTVSIFLDYLFGAIGAFPAYTYGKRWIIVNETTGERLLDIGSDFSLRTTGSRTDRRSLAEVGIRAGDRLYVEYVGRSDERAVEMTPSSAFFE